MEQDIRRKPALWIEKATWEQNAFERQIIEWKRAAKVPQTR